MLLKIKECITCRESKPAEEFYFRKQTGKLQGDCKICYQLKKTKRRNERRANGEYKYIPKKKKCIDCDNLCDARKRVVRCYSCENKKRWKNEDRVLRQIEQNKKMWRNQEYRNKMSACMTKLRQTENFNQKLCDAIGRSGRVSKLHHKVKQALRLEKMGFISERLVGTYFVDELNEEKKIIIEINGDYVHANPKLFQPDSIIKMPGHTYTAAEKWESNKQRNDVLTSMGYRVITIWESDDLNEVKKQLTQGE